MWVCKSIPWSWHVNWTANAHCDVEFSLFTCRHCCFIPKRSSFENLSANVWVYTVLWVCARSIALSCSKRLTLYTVIYGRGLAPHYKGCRKRAPCFTLINGCDWVAELLKPKHTQLICLDICLSGFLYVASLSAAFLSSCQTLDQSFYQSHQTSLLQSSMVKRLYLRRRVTRMFDRSRRRLSLPVTSTTSDSNALGTISMTDWPPTVCWLTGREASGGKGERLANILVSTVSLYPFCQILPVDAGR